MANATIASGDARPIPPKSAVSSAVLSSTESPASASTEDYETLVTALRKAKNALYEVHIGARSVIALLDKIDLADVVAASACHSDDYDLVHPVDLLLAHLRDDSYSEIDALDAVLQTMTRCLPAGGAR